MFDLIHVMPSAISNQLLEEATPLLGLDWEEITKTSTIISTPGIVSNAALDLMLRAVSIEWEWLIYSVNSLFHKP
jgi:hypothetical protein